MKKIWILLTSMMLLLTGVASASGLGGLSGGGNGSGLSGLSAGHSGLLPDPCLAIDDYDGVGTLYMKDYQFSADYLCDAYIYPRQPSKFIGDYTVVLREFGYTMTETTVDGLAGYSIQNGDGKVALLVPNFEGNLLLLVENGMDFVLMDVCTVTYNGADYHMSLYFTDTPDNYPHDRWGMTFKVENGYFERLSIDIPKDVRSGSSYEIMDESDCFDGLKMDYYRNYDFKTLLYDSVVLYRSDGIENSRDYATFYISRVEDTPYGRLIVGTFECRFYKGADVFEGGEFAAVIPN